MRIKFTLCALAVAAVASTTAGFAQAQDFKPRIVRFGYGLVDESNQGRAVRMFAKEVEKASGGKMKVRAIGNASLGSDTQMQQALIGGAQEMMVGSTATLVGLVPEMAIWDTPFLFTSAKEADTVLDGPSGDKVKSKLEAKGMVGLVYWENGFRNLTNSKRPVTKVEDLNDVKLRVMQNNVFLDSFKALGANAVPLPFSELFTALETRAVDGQENPFNTVLSSKFYEVQKYFSATRHIYNPQMIMVGKKFWDTLSADEKKIFEEAAIEARDVQRKAARAMTDKSRKVMTDHGMKLNEIAPEEIVRMRAAVKPVTDKYAAQLDPELVKAFYAELEKTKNLK